MKLRNRFLFGLVLSTVSGVLLLLSFPPYGHWWLAWFAFVPAIYAQYRLLPLKYSSLAPAIYLLVWLGPYMARLFGTEFGPFFTYLGVLIAILSFFLNRERSFVEKTGYRWLVIQGIAGWVGFEMVRATFIPIVATSAFIGYTQATQAWLIQPVSIFSIYGLNIIIMLVNYALAQMIIGRLDHKQNSDVHPKMNKRISTRWLATAGILLAAWIGISLVIQNSAPKESEIVQVAALRANFPLPAHQDKINTSAVRFEKFAEMANEAAASGARILVTSEMMFNFDPQIEYTSEFRAISRNTDTFIFISYSVLKEGVERVNQTVLLSPDGTFSQVYNKFHIPPGERYDVQEVDFPVFNTPIGKLAAMICHDGNYTDVARKLTSHGAQLIAAGFKEFPGFGEQLWQNLTFRAIENRTAVVVTGATSVAAIINPNGQIVALDVDKDGSEVILNADVKLGTGQGTPYTATGDVLGWVSMAVFGLMIVFQIIVGNRIKKENK